MYPNTYLNLFPPFPRDKRIFVAMSFDSRFDARWQNVLAPAIRRVTVTGVALEPHRVDLLTASDSVLTEILEGISRCRFFLADITDLGDLDGNPVRNANVLYEVGIAHATRLPQEVLLLRSDRNKLLFDIMNVRVLEYDPDGDPATAQNFVVNAIEQSLDELNLTQSLTVRRIAESLDIDTWWLLLEITGVGPSKTKLTAKRRQTIGRLFDAGLMSTTFLDARRSINKRGLNFSECVTYSLTELGRLVVRYGRDQMHILSPSEVSFTDQEPGV